LSTDETDLTIGRLHRERREVTEKRLQVVERVKQIATALRKLADAIDTRPDFDAVSKDSILQEYLDLSKIGALVLEEQQLSAKQMDYDERLRALGFF
jgi:hypothetical protein